MEIRLADKKDINHIAELYIKNHKITYKNLLSEEYLANLTLDYGRAKWETYLSDENKKIWVACENGLFLGFVAGMEDPELEFTWYLDSLHVTENARGKGVGTALIQTIGGYALEHHYQKMSICIVKGNDQAGRLYKKLGAKHDKDFIDSFGNTTSYSEKLLWEELTLFMKRSN